MKVLAKYKLFLHSKKCEFDKQQIKYLSLVILEDQVKINPMKVAKVHNWPTLQSHTKLQVFCDFYQQFICRFPTIAYFIFNLTYNNNTWTQTIDQKTVFNALNTTVTFVSILAFLDTTTLFHIKADSSDYITKAVLSKKSKINDKQHLVVFFSKSLFSAKHNYKIHNKKILAIIQTVRCMLGQLDRRVKYFESPGNPKSIV